ncbi:hypothetical protein [Magnetococcus marinus]|uniref:hypothetical protein n=1 Tax=Magnetococcus marinus TaxID=1124597 RepID=UPI000054467E|nr:hypothetical protein [Magnetococcus marinus]
MVPNAIPIQANGSMLRPLDCCTAHLYWKMRCLFHPEGGSVGAIKKATGPIQKSLNATLKRKSTHTPHFFLLLPDCVWCLVKTDALALEVGLRIRMVVAWVKYGVSGLFAASFFMAWMFG